MGRGGAGPDRWPARRVADVTPPVTPPAALSVPEPRRIAPANLPPRLPVLATVTLWLVMDRVQPGGLVTGIVWTLAALYWLMQLAARWYYEPVDVLEGCGGAGGLPDTAADTSLLTAPLTTTATAALEAARERSQLA